MSMWLVLLFLGVAAAAPPDADRIIGGYECRPHSQPWVASLNLGYHSCGGALIADQWVVSAAHCSYYAQAMLVILGEHNLQVFEHTEYLMHVETVVTHPNYNEETLDYDIMLVKLAQPVQRDANVQPVALPTACATAGTSCVMSGWGNTLSNGILGSDQLRCVEVPILSHQVCEDAYPNRVTSTMLCAGHLQGGKDACEGDAGGPLVCAGELQGIMSWGFGWAQKNYPSLYTKVCDLLPWIQDTMATH